MPIKVAVNKTYHQLLTDQSRVVCVLGGGGCFLPNQKVITKRGSIPISEVKENDMVLSYNEETEQNEYKRCLKVIPQKNNSNKLIRIKLKNGTVINVTENHKFYFGGAWVKIKDILLSLKK